MKLHKGKKLHKHEDDEVGVTKSAGKWYSKGFDGAKKDKEEADARRQGYVKEFWLGNGEKSYIRFASSESLNIYQHRIRVGNWWKNVTCINPENDPNLDSCPLCEKAVTKQWVGVYVVIERKREWKSKKDGKSHVDKNAIKIWRCGRKVYAALEDLKEEMGKLTGFDVRVSRAGEGKDSTYQIRPGEKSPLGLDDEKMKEIEDFDLVKVLEPKSRKEMLVLSGGSRLAEEEDIEDKEEEDDEENEVLNKF